jgi:putative transposase
MLERVGDWREYLDTTPDGTDLDLIRRHARTGRPLGSRDFVETLEGATGRPLAPGKRGRKPRPV